MQTIILHVVLNKCENSCPKLKERQIENFPKKILRKIIGPDAEEVT
jgi:hypothetical protein